MGPIFRRFESSYYCFKILWNAKNRLPLTHILKKSLLRSNPKTVVLSVKKADKLAIDNYNKKIKEATESVVSKKS